MRNYFLNIEGIIAVCLIMAVSFQASAQAPSADELFNKMQQAYAQKEILAYNVTDTGDFSPGKYLVIFEKDSTKNLIGGNFLIRRSDGFFKVCYEDSSFWVHSKYKKSYNGIEGDRFYHETPNNFMYFFGYAENSDENKYLQIEQTDSSYIRKYIMPDDYINRFDIDKNKYLIIQEIDQNTKATDSSYFSAFKIEYLDTDKGNYSDTIRLWYQKSKAIPEKKPEKSTDLKPRITLDEGKKIPDFKGILWKDSTEFSLEKTRNEKKKVFIFWSLTCGPCYLMIDRVNTLTEQFPDADIYTVLSPEMSNFSKEKVRRTINRLNSNIPLILVSEDVFKTYKVEAFPTTFVTDKKLKLNGQWSGVGKTERIKEMLSKLLNQ